MLADVEDCDVVHLTHARHPQRRGQSTLGQVGACLGGLDVDDDVRPGHGALDRLLDRVGSRMALADRRARRDADDHVGEMATRRPAHAQAPGVTAGSSVSIARWAASTASAGAWSMRRRRFAG